MSYYRSLIGHFNLNLNLWLIINNASTWIGPEKKNTPKEPRQLYLSLANDRQTSRYQNLRAIRAHRIERDHIGERILQLDRIANGHADLSDQVNGAHTPTLHRLESNLVEAVLARLLIPEHDPQQGRALLVRVVVQPVVLPAIARHVDVVVALDGGARIRLLGLQYFEGHLEGEYF